MSCSVYLEYTRRAEVSAVAKSASDFMQRLLRLRNRPTIEGWSMDGYDWILMRPILVTPKRFLDEARAIFTTCDREAFSHVTYDAEFPLMTGTPTSVRGNSASYVTWHSATSRMMRSFP